MIRKLKLNVSRVGSIVSVKILEQTHREKDFIPKSAPYPGHPGLTYIKNSDGYLASYRSPTLKFTSIPELYVLGTLQDHDSDEVTCNLTTETLAKEVVQKIGSLERFYNSMYSKPVVEPGTFVFRVTDIYGSGYKAYFEELDSENSELALIRIPGMKEPIKRVPLNELKVLPSSEQPKFLLQDIRRRQKKVS